MNYDKEFYETNSYKRLITDDKILFDIISKSFDKLYNYDHYLIDNSPFTKFDEQIGGLHHVGERSIVFRFGFYLQMLLYDSMYKYYNVDCEYNRNGENAKTLPSFPNGIYPDIIIHKRNRNDMNLLVMEFKTYWNNNTKTDEKKIIQLIDPNGNYKYKYGMSVLIEPNRAHINTLDYKE